MIEFGAWFLLACIVFGVISILIMLMCLIAVGMVRLGRSIHETARMAIGLQQCAKLAQISKLELASRQEAWEQSLQESPYHLTIYQTRKAIMVDVLKFESPRPIGKHLILPAHEPKVVNHSDSEKVLTWDELREDRYIEFEEADVLYHEPMPRSFGRGNQRDYLKAIDRGMELAKIFR